MKKEIIDNIYSKPSKLNSYISEIEQLQKKIANYDDKLYHLLNRINATIAADSGVTLSPQFQKYVEKKDKLESEREETQDKIYSVLNSMLANFRNTKIEDFDDIKTIYEIIDFATKNVSSETDKGAILSNVLSLKVSPEMENNLYNGVETIVDKDRGLLTGFLMNDQENPERKLEYFEPVHNLDSLFINSLRNRGTNRYNSGIAKIILQDKGYTENMFNLLGKDVNNVIKAKGLTKEEKAYLKKQYHNYRIERTTNSKLNGKFLKCSALLPSAIGKIFYGTTYGLGFLFGLVNKGLKGVGFALAYPFNAIAKGLNNLSYKSNLRTTYQDDEKDIYKNIKRTLKSNGFSVKRLNSVKVDVQKIDDMYVLSLSGSTQMKGNVEGEFNMLYNIREGEYNNFKELFRDHLRDEDDEVEENFIIGNHKDKPEFIRFMRRVAEIINEEEALYVDSKEILESEEVEKINRLQQRDKVKDDKKLLSEKINDELDDEI